MIVRRLAILARPPPPALSTPTIITAIHKRALHVSLPLPPIPPPNREAPDVTTFLSKIGRNATQHATKFSSWDVFFSSTSTQLRELGVEPARDRRYILRWRETYRVLGGNVKLVEQKRGRKIDGGERRWKEVRAKRRSEENKEKKRIEQADELGVKG